MTLPKNTAISIVFTGLIGVLYAASSTILLNSIRQAEKHTRQAVAGFQVSYSNSRWLYTVLRIGLSGMTLTPLLKMLTKITLKKISPQNDNFGCQPSIFIQPGRLVYGTGIDIIHRRKPSFQQRYKRTYLPRPAPTSQQAESSTTGIVLLPEAQS